MDRRRFLRWAGGGAVAAPGGTALARETRADVLLDPELNRARGDPETIERTVDHDAVGYRASTGEVVENGRTQSFEDWARLECGDVATDAVVGVVADRIGRDLESVGSGLRSLVFGFVLTVDHNVLRNRDGEVISEPNVPVDRLIEAAPRSLTVTVALDGGGEDREYTRTFPVGVGHSEVQYL
ncbi:hypothetical protein [Halomicrobium urmianum]|uniref:hypothetical protein n=1 Tax=Halomicrobium urmianum TaxID=1586233 RepID=UPI001CD91DA8|nr:hypothetical protein [Halomicrobium urmianum]